MNKQIEIKIMIGRLLYKTNYDTPNNQIGREIREELCVEKNTTSRIYKDLSLPLPMASQKRLR